MVAHFEMEAIGVVTDRFRPADIAVQRAHPDRVQFGQLVRLYRNIGQEFVYPAMALVLALAGLCFLRAGNARFTRTFDLEKLMAEQAIHSRSTAAFVGRGLKLSKLRGGDPRPADAALHADEWVARYATSEKSGFDEAAARREFMRQLGGRWTGPAAASEPVRCMLAVFALQGVQRRDEAAALLATPVRKRCRTPPGTWPARRQGAGRAAVRGRAGHRAGDDLLAGRGRPVLLLPQGGPVRRAGRHRLLL